MAEAPIDAVTVASVTKPHQFIKVHWSRGANISSRISQSFRRYISLNKYNIEIRKSESGEIVDVISIKNIVRVDTPSANPYVDATQHPTSFDIIAIESQAQGRRIFLTLLLPQNATEGAQQIAHAIKKAKISIKHAFIDVVVNESKKQRTAEGWLVKRKHSLLKVSRRRFFTLRGAGGKWDLSWWKGENLKHKYGYVTLTKDSTVQLTEATRIRIDISATTVSDGRKNSRDDDSGAILRLEAASTAEAMQWKNDIENAIRSCQSAAKIHQHPTHQRRSSVQTAPVPELHDAVLSIDLNMSDDYSVSRRFAILRPPHLLLYRDETEVVECRKFDLSEICSIREPSIHHSALRLPSGRELNSFDLIARGRGRDTASDLLTIIPLVTAHAISKEDADQVLLSQELTRIILNWKPEARVGSHRTSQQALFLRFRVKRAPVGGFGVVLRKFPPDSRSLMVWPGKLGSTTLRVQMLTSNGPCEQAGLRLNDVVIAINGDTEATCSLRNASKHLLQKDECIIDLVRMPFQINIEDPQWSQWSRGNPLTDPAGTKSDQLLRNAYLQHPDTPLNPKIVNDPRFANKDQDLLAMQQPSSETYQHTLKSIVPFSASFDTFEDVEEKEEREEQPVDDEHDGEEEEGEDEHPFDNFDFDNDNTDSFIGLVNDLIQEKESKLEHHYRMSQLQQLLKQNESEEDKTPKNTPLRTIHSADSITVPTPTLSTNDLGTEMSEQTEASGDPETVNEPPSAKQLLEKEESSDGLTLQEDQLPAASSEPPLSLHQPALSLSPPLSESSSSAQQSTPAMPPPSSPSPPSSLPSPSLILSKSTSTPPPSSVAAAASLSQQSSISSSPPTYSPFTPFTPAPPFTPVTPAMSPVLPVSHEVSLSPLLPPSAVSTPASLSEQRLSPPPLSPVTPSPLSPPFASSQQQQQQQQQLSIPSLSPTSSPATSSPPSQQLSKPSTPLPPSPASSSQSPSSKATPTAASSPPSASSQQELSISSSLTTSSPATSSSSPPSQQLSKPSTPPPSSPVIPQSSSQEPPSMSSSPPSASRSAPSSSAVSALAASPNVDVTVTKNEDFSPSRCSQEQRLETIDSLATFTPNKTTLANATVSTPESVSSQASPAESADRIKPKADDVSKGRIDQPQVEAKSAEAEMQPHVAAAKGQKDASKKADETPPSKRATPAATASAAPIPSQVVYEKSVSEHKEVDKEKQVLSLLRKMKELLTEAMMTEAKTLAEEIIALDPENVVANATLSRSNKNIFRNLKKARFRRKNSKRERERIDSTCGAF